MKAIASLFCTILALVPAVAAPPRPNIVVILADDMGFSDIGCYGGEIATPSIDRLAAEGVRFTQFYNTGRCCPTRASLLTGVYPHQAGIGHMVDPYAEKVRARLGGPGYSDRLSDRCVTIAEALGAAGYETLMTGKWHVGAAREAWPDQRGFARTFSVVGSGAMNYFGRGVQHLDKTVEMQLERDGELWRAPDEGFHATDAFTDAALDFLRERKDPQRPFFLYLAYNAPHWPLHALPEDIARYRGKYRDGFGQVRKARLARQIEMGLFPKETPLLPRDPQVKAWGELSDAQRDDMDLRMAIYAAQVDRMDRNIGRVLAALREMGAEENTLVLFLSDNGGCHEGIERSKPGAELGTRDSYSSYRRGWAQVSNTPFRSYKHWTHEGGIATPLVVRWPARITQRGGFVPEPGHVIDIMATALDAAGAEPPKSLAGRELKPLEGVSLLPALRGEPLARKDALFWEHEGNRAVRAGDWKLVSAFPGEWELYNLATDRVEMRDLAAEQPEKVRELAARYDAWAARSDVRDWTLTRAAARQ
jgi:arylsulfatase A-like enzyme